MQIMRHSSNTAELYANTIHCPPGKASMNHMNNKKNHNFLLQLPCSQLIKSKKLSMKENFLHAIESKEEKEEDVCKQ